MHSKHEADARRSFDDWARSTTFQRLRPWLAYTQSQVLDRIDWHKAKYFLDVACGSGWAVQEAARRLSAQNGGLACGCDISEGMLMQRIGSHPQAVFSVASGQALPYRDQVFDVIICTAAFHHLPRPLEALAEFRRVLRAGGLLLIADSCRDQSPLVWAWDRLHRWFEKGHVQYYRRDELRSLLDIGGFLSIQVIELNPTYAQVKKLVRKATLFCAICP